ncbi:unnamed protein product [Symbiodinium sp. KB8]|nr:unnamed protein product [Symbiodinium sp. KB8]
MCLLVAPADLAFLTGFGSKVSFHSRTTFKKEAEGAAGLDVELRAKLAESGDLPRAESGVQGLLDTALHCGGHLVAFVFGLAHDLHPRFVVDATNRRLVEEVQKQTEELSTLTQQRLGDMEKLSKQEEAFSREKDSWNGSPSNLRWVNVLSEEALPVSPSAVCTTEPSSTRQTGIDVSCKVITRSLCAANYAIWAASADGVVEKERRYDQVEVREEEEAAPSGSARYWKITEQKELRQKQWAQVEKDTIRAFAKQKQAYEAELAKLDRDYAEAMECGNLSVAQVKAIVVGMQAPPAQRELAEMEASEAWAAFWRQTGEPAPGASFLQEAMPALALQQPAAGQCLLTWVLDAWGQVTGAALVEEALRVRSGSAWADLTFAVLLRRIMQRRDQCKVSSMSDWKQGSLPMRSPAKRSRSPSGPARQQPSIISMGRVAQRELYATKPEITVLRETGGAAQLPVVDSYKHLGVIRLRKAASDRSCSSAGRLRGRHFGKAGIPRLVFLADEDSFPEQLGRATLPSFTDIELPLQCLQAVQEIHFVMRVESAFLGRLASADIFCTLPTVGGSGGLFSFRRAPGRPKFMIVCPHLLWKGGLLAQCHEEYDPATYSRGLLDAPEARECPTTDGVWGLVSDFIEPLDTPRTTLRIWQDRAGADPLVTDAAADAILMLDPELICDTFCRPKESSSVPICCGDLPGLLSAPFPFILTGEVRVFHLEAPPCPAFCYPFI